MSNTIYSDKIKVNCPLIHDENGYYHLVYKIVNTVNGKVYIGKHSTKDPYDGYFGSGIKITQAIEKYKQENFIKEILFCFTNENGAFLKEEELVTQEFVDRDDTYNIAIGGKGFGSGEANPMYGRTGEKNPFYGRKHSRESLNKMSKANKGKLAGEKNPMYGKPRSQETRNKISNSLKGKMTGEKNPFYGKRGEKCPNFGANNPFAKVILKIDELGNIVNEYGCMKDCCKRENTSMYILRKLLKEHILYNGFYFEFKPKN